MRRRGPGHDKDGEVIGAGGQCGDELIVHAVEPQDRPPVDGIVDPERLICGRRLRGIVGDAGAVAPLTHEVCAVFRDTRPGIEPEPQPGVQRLLRHPQADEALSQAAHRGSVLNFYQLGFAEIDHRELFGVGLA